MNHKKVLYTDQSREIGVINNQIFYKKACKTAENQAPWVSLKKEHDINKIFYENKNSLLLPITNVIENSSYYEIDYPYLEETDISDFIKNGTFNFDTDWDKISTHLESLNFNVKTKDVETINCNKILFSGKSILEFFSNSLHHNVLVRQEGTNHILDKRSINIIIKKVIGIEIEELYKNIEGLSIFDSNKLWFIHGDLQGGYFNPYYNKPWPGNFYYDACKDKLYIIDLDWACFTKNKAIGTAYDLCFLVLSLYSGKNIEFTKSILRALSHKLVSLGHNNTQVLRIVYLGLLTAFLYRQIPRIIEYSNKKESEFNQNSNDRVEWATFIFHNLHKLI